MNVKKVILQIYQARRDVPFAYDQVNDCLGFAGECARAITGKDPLVLFYGAYDSEMTVKRLMVANGWRSMGDWAASLFPEIPPSMARSGDWAQIENADGSDLLGVFVGERVVAKTKTGVGQALFSQVKRAFRVVEE